MTVSERDTTAYRLGAIIPKLICALLVLAAMLAILGVVVRIMVDAWKAALS